MYTFTGSDDDLPENFQATANWDFSIVLDAHSNGSFNLSSTPSLAIAAGIFGSIDRAISANITYDSGVALRAKAQAIQAPRDRSIREVTLPERGICPRAVAAPRGMSAERVLVDLERKVR